MKQWLVTAGTMFLLCCLSAPAWAAKPVHQEGRPYVIEIAVVNGEIDMGEKYAYAVPPGSVIRWTCDSAFEVQFNVNAPFETTAISSRAIEKRIKPDAKLLQIYKYTITVIGDGKPLILDPVIIVRPPRTEG